MAKPSIFSKKYDKTRRRRRFFKQLALVILLLIALFFIFRNPIMDKVNKVKQDITEEELVTNTPSQEPEPESPQTQVESPAEEEKILLTYGIGEEKELSFEMEKNDGNLIFKTPNAIEGYELDLSPSKTQLVVLDADTQELYLAKNSGEITNITYRVYKSSKGYTESKESILNRTPGFIWAEQPRFLDEETVVYMSQLPWFDDRKFLYIVELNPLTHRNFQSVFGRDLVLKDLDDKGLAYEKADKMYYLTSEYKIINP
jgi:hypothetical protein